MKNCFPVVGLLSSASGSALPSDEYLYTQSLDSPAFDNSFVILPDSSTISIEERSPAIPVRSHGYNNNNNPLTNTLSFPPSSSLISSSKDESAVTVPDIELLDQTCARQEDASRNGSPHLVVVKDRTFELRIGLKSFLEKPRHEYYIDLHQLKLNIDLVFDESPNKLVPGFREEAHSHSSNNKAPSFSSSSYSSIPASSSSPNSPLDVVQVRVGTEGTVATVEVRARVLTSKLKDSLFRVRIAPVHPSTQQVLVEKAIWSYPIRVISKPDKGCTAHKKIVIERSGKDDASSALPSFVSSAPAAKREEGSSLAPPPATKSSRKRSYKDISKQLLDENCKPSLNNIIKPEGTAKKSFEDCFLQLVESLRNVPSEERPTKIQRAMEKTSMNNGDCLAALLNGLTKSSPSVSPVPWSEEDDALNSLELQPSDFESLESMCFEIPSSSSLASLLSSFSTSEGESCPSSPRSQSSPTPPFTAKLGMPPTYSFPVEGFDFPLELLEDHSHIF